MVGGRVTSLESRFDVARPSAGSDLEGDELELRCRPINVPQAFEVIARVDDCQRSHLLIECGR
jgi:hypothetical protein